MTGARPSREGSAIARSPSDVLRLVVAAAALLAMLLVEALFGSAVVSFASDLLRGLDVLGDGLITASVLVVRVAGVALLAVGLTLALSAGRWRAAGTVALAALVGVAAFALADQFIQERRPALADLSDVAGPLTDPGFPSSPGLAAIAAAVTAIAAWAPRRYRRAGWVVLLALASVRFLVAPVSGAALAALLSGWFGGALVVVLLGAPSRRPQSPEIQDGLRSVGVDLTELVPASVDARGSTPWFGTTEDGRLLFVKVLGEDERSADLLFRMYRALAPRNRGDERPFSSLRRAVEHEALVSLSAGQLGVRTPPVVAFTDADPGGWVLAYGGVRGRSLDRVPAEALTDEVLDQVWSEIAVLRRHRVAHRDLRLANVFLDDAGGVWLIDFGFAELAASELLLATDLAELLAALSLQVGAKRAVDSGAAVLGGGALRSGLPRLRAAYLSGATRTALKSRPQLLDEIRREVVAGRAPSAVPAGGDGAR
jgi:glycosyltransferase 2 family protein